MQELWINRHDLAEFCTAKSSKNVLGTLSRHLKTKNKSVIIKSSNRYGLFDAIFFLSHIELYSALEYVDRQLEDTSMTNFTQHKKAWNRYKTILTCIKDKHEGKLQSTENN